MQHWNSIQNSFNVSKNHRTFVPKMLVPKLTFMYRSGLYRYFVCIESDCSDIDIQCTETGCTEKTCTKSVCTGTKTVMYRKRPTPYTTVSPDLSFNERANSVQSTDTSDPRHFGTIETGPKCPESSSPMPK